MASTQPLPGLPDYVLDRGPAGIDTSAANYGQAFSTAPMLQIQGVLDEARGAADLGRGVAGVGGAMHQLGMEVLKARAIKQESDADTAMSQAQDELAVKIAREPDESKWAGISEEHISGVRDKLGTMATSQVAREAIDTKLSRWSAHTRSSVLVDSARESIQKAKQAFNTKLEIAMETGDRGLLDQVFSTGEANGYFTPEQRKLGGIRFDQRQEVKQKQAAAEARTSDFDRVAQSIDPAQGGNPHEALKALSSVGKDGRSVMFPNLDPTDLMRAQGMARESVHRDQAATQEAILNGVASPKGLSEQEVKDMAGMSRLGEEDVRRLLDHRKKLAEQAASALPFDMKDALQLSAEIEKFNPDGMPKEQALAAWVALKQRTDLVAARGGEEGHQTGGVFNQRLYQLHPLHERRKGEAGLPEGVETQFNSIMKTYLAQGETSKDYTLAEREQERRNIKLRYSLFDQLQKEAKANPASVFDESKGGLDGWVARKMKGVRAAKIVPTPAAPDGGFLPVADPNEAFKQIIK